MDSAFSLVIEKSETHQIANRFFYSFFNFFMYQNFIGFEKSVLDTLLMEGSVFIFEVFFFLRNWICLLCLILSIDIMFVITFYTNFNKNSVRKDSRS